MQQSCLPVKRACLILGLNPKRLNRWKERFLTHGLFGLNDKLPIAKCRLHALLDSEKKEIVSYALNHPEQHHREIQFNLDKLSGAHVSFSSVYRQLKRSRLIKEHRFLKSKGGNEKPVAACPHEIWGVDITYIRVGKGFWYLIAVIDLYSRYIVGWELSPTMTGDDVKRVLDFTLLEFGFHDKEQRPRIHSDNGPQMKAHTLKQFFFNLGMSRDFSRPHTPQDQAIIERFFRTLKQEEVYRNEYEAATQARDAISKFIGYYNHRRPHQGIGFVTPHQMLTGQAEQIIKERKQRLLLAQETRKLRNRQNRERFTLNPVELSHLQASVQVGLSSKPQKEGVQEPKVLRNEFAKVSQRV